MTKIRITPLSRLLVCSSRWIRDLVSKGILPDPVKGYFDLNQCIPKYIAFLRSSSPSQELQRLRGQHLHQRIEKLKVEQKIVEGSLVPKTESEKKVEQVVVLCEENFRTFPYRVVPILAMIPKREDEQELMVHILRHEIEACWRALAGVRKKQTPVVFPGDIILVCLGLISGDGNGEVIVERCSPPFKQRMKVMDILEKYGSGIDALRNPLLGGSGDVPVKNKEVLG